MPPGLRHAVLTAIVVAACGLGITPDASAQLNGQNIKGDLGVKSGSQPPPGGYVFVPLYFYRADSLRNRNGDEVARGSLEASIFGAGFNYVTTKKIGGANYGVMVVLPFASERLQGGRIDESSGTGLTDMFVQPFSLGWHTARTDTTVGYGLYVPIGRYEDGSQENTGLGMWGHEWQAGATLYLDETREWSVATTAFLNVFSEKRDSETRVGNILTLEGGVGKDFLDGGLGIGLAYYAGYKLTDDQLGPLANVLVRGRNRGYGVGPEVTLAIAAKQTVYGFVTVRYQWELGARVGPQGGAVNVVATFLTRPIRP